MTLTAKLKGWLIEQKLCSETASETDMTAAAEKAVADGKLTKEKLDELTKAETASPAAVIEEIVARALAPLAGKVAELASKVEDQAKAGVGLADRVATAIDKAVSRPEATAQDSANRPAQLFGAAAVDEKSPQVRVKAAVERYMDSKGVLLFPEKHYRAGEPADLAGEPIMSLSQRDRAICGAFWKFAAAASCRGPVPRFLRMTDHDRDLVQYAIHEMPWTGIVGCGPGDGAGEDAGGRKVHGRKLNDFEIKALLDDTTSGGLEAAPIVFDAAVITVPVLYGELFPLVNVVPVARGRRVEGFSITNPTFTSGTAEGTAISLFNTASMIAAFDTTIYNAVGAIEIGNDFQEDSPVAIGALITEAYGRKALEWLDNQIANGDGTTEPQGIVNASGMTDIGNPVGGANAAPQITDYENLYFGIAKQFRPASDAARTVFLANDTSYKRARAIAVGTSDARRVFGMDHQAYTVLNAPYKVQNDMANTFAACVNFRHYRLYRRLGLNVRVETTGQTLALKNTTLIVVRMRWGGKIEQGGAAAYSDNWQT